MLTQLDGVSPEEHRRLVRELAEAQRKCISCELELRAALDKLEVYRRTDAAAACGGAAQHGSVAAAFVVAAGGLAALAGQPDEGKSEAELQHELAQMRGAMALEAEELSKVRAVRRCACLAAARACCAHAVNVVLLLPPVTATC